MNKFTFASNDYLSDPSCRDIDQQAMEELEQKFRKERIQARAEYRNQIKSKVESMGGLIAPERFEVSAIAT